MTSLFSGEGSNKTVSILRWIRSLAATLYGLVILAVGAAGSAANLQYDDGGLGSFFFIALPFLGFMFYLPSEMLSSLGGGTTLPFQALYSIAIGLGSCAAVDLFRYWLRKRRKIREIIRR